MLRDNFDGFDKAAKLGLEYFKMRFLPVKPLKQSQSGMYQYWLEKYLIRLDKARTSNRLTNGRH
jgi:hypothetical protein